MIISRTYYENDYNQFNFIEINDFKNKLRDLIVYKK